ncbi:MAG: hypothetical protein QXK24_05570 [Ignisphaera sp.]
MISYSLNWLILVCREGKPCVIGRYALSKRLYRVYRETFDDHVMVMVGITYRKRGWVLTFTVDKINVSPPRTVLPFDVEGCVPGICVDGVNVQLGDYTRYMYNSYALLYKDLGDRYTGNLFFVDRISLPGLITRWRMRRALSRLIKT